MRGNARFGDQIRIGNGSTSWDWLSFDGDSKEARIHFGNNSNEMRFGRYANNFGAWESNPFILDMDASDSTLRVTGNSRVGIGTGSPAYKLDVVGDAQVQGWLRTTGDRGWFNQTYGGGWHMTDSTWIRSYGGKPVYVASNLRTDSELQVGSNGGRFVVQTGGNVGIGTTSPTAKLDVRAPSARVRVQDQGLLVNDAETTSGEVRVGSAWNRPGVYSSTSLNLLGTSSLSLSGRGNNTDLHINSSGNIGVGRTNPTAKFDVNGEVKISTGSPTMRFDDSNGDGFMIHNNSDHLYIMRDDNRNDSWDDGDDDRVVIRGSGTAVNLGVRTSSPADPLDVRGNARFGDQLRIGNALVAGTG